MNDFEVTVESIFDDEVRLRITGPDGHDVTFMVQEGVTLGLEIVYPADEDEAEEEEVLEVHGEELPFSKSFKEKPMTLWERMDAAPVGTILRNPEADRNFVKLPNGNWLPERSYTGYKPREFNDGFAWEFKEPGS